MIRTVRIEVNAAYPDMPLERTAVYTGSAASFTIINVPRKHGKRDITGVSVSVKNAAGATQSFAAVRDGCAWNATVPASAIGAAGNIERGLVIAASGVDENEGVVPCWILGCGDIAVMPLDGQIAPGETATNLRGFDETPSAPSKWNVRRSSSGFEVYDGTSWVALGGVGDMKHSEFEGLEWRDNMTQKESNTLLGEIVSKLKGTALLLLCACCLPALAVPLSPDMDFGDISPTAKVSAVIHAAVDGAARPLPKYLHLYDANDSYPAEAAEYYRQRGSGVPAASCSAVRDGGFLYRNFDYPFDDRAEFVVKMSAGPNSFASVGVAQVGTNLTEQMVTSGKPEYSNIYKWLPGATVDGINENGVVAEINVVDTPVTGWHTNATSEAIHPLGAIRWILDNATNAQHAATYIAANIRFPQGWTQNFHYMIADATSTYIVENGTVTDGDEYHEPDEPVTMTNFQLSKFPWDGMGTERFGLLLGGANITNAWYTRAYRRETNPPWVSDLADVIAYTNEIFDAWAEHPKEYFRGKTNGGIPWWQSVHTSIYDITNRTLRVAVQEIDDWYTFQVPVTAPKIDAYTKAETDAKLAEKIGGGDVPSFEQDPTVGLTNGTIHIKGQAITPITEHQDVSGFVPYSGAEYSVDLGNNDLSTSGCIQGEYVYADFAFCCNYTQYRDGLIHCPDDNEYFLPGNVEYGKYPMFDFALRSQIEDATNGLAQTIPQKINAAVSANLNTYIDGETGVEYVGKFYGGSLYYVPTGNVYPPNN